MNNLAEFTARSGVLGFAWIALLLAGCGKAVEPAKSATEGAAPPTASVTPASSQSTGQGELTVTQTLGIAGEEGTFSFLVIHSDSAGTSVVEKIFEPSLNGAPQELLRQSLAEGAYSLTLSQHFCPETGCPPLDSPEAREFVEASQRSFPCEGRFDLHAGQGLEAAASIGTPGQNAGPIECDLDIKMRGG